jgi:hypothetical protein
LHSPLRKATWLAASSLYILSVLAVLPLVPYGCGKEGKSGDAVLARVGSSKLRVRDLRAAFPHGEGANISGSQARLYVQRWINTELLQQEARRRGLNNDIEIRRELLNVERELLANALFEQVLGGDVEVSEEETREFFEENPEMFLREEEEARVLQILVTTWQQANEIRSRLLAGEKFDSLATAHSLDPSAARGGDMGYVTRDGLPQEVAREAFRLRIDRVSSPIRSALGYHIIRVVDRQPEGSVKDLSQVRGVAREQVTIQKIRDARRELIARLRTARDVYTNFELLSGIVADSTERKETQGP